jgi:hypothetical protein
MREATSFHGAHGYNVVVAMRHKSTGEDGGNGGANDSKRSKMRPDLNSTIIIEKLDIGWNHPSIAFGPGAAVVVTCTAAPELPQRDQACLPFNWFVDLKEHPMCRPCSSPPLALSVNFKSKIYIFFE